MKKRLFAVVATITMAAVLACPVLAAWQPSKTVQEVSGVQASVTSPDGTTTALEITVTPRTGANAEVEDVLTATDAYIKVTPVSETRAANDALDAERPALVFGEKAGETTNSGLRYSDNEKVNLVYEAVTRSTSTTQFLEKVGGVLLDLVTEAVNDLASDNPDQTVSVDDFAPAALFDVTASAGALELMGDTGSVDVEIEVPGITADSNIIAVHFLGEVEDAEAMQEALANDFDNAVLNYDAEILDAVAGDGTVTVTMTSFSPVMILTRTAAVVTEEPEDTAATAANDTEATPEPSAAPMQTEAEVDNGGSGWVLPVVIVAIVVVAGIAVAVTRKNKQTTTSGSKK